MRERERAIFLFEPRERDRTRLRIEPALEPLRELCRAGPGGPMGGTTGGPTGGPASDKPGGDEPGSTEVELRALPRSFAGRVELAGECRGATVILPARLLSWPALAMLRSAARTLILDLDDAMGEVPDDQPVAVSRTRRGRLRRTLAAVDLVTTGSQSLARMIRAVSPEGLPITPVPNPIVWSSDLEPGPARRGEPTLLWIGSRSTRSHLERVRPTLESLAGELPGLTLLIIADAGAVEAERARTPGRLRVEVEAWSEAAAAAGLREAWLGLMPLAETAWSRGKSGYKLLQYMAAGLPALATAGGVADELLPEDSAGLVSRPEDWQDAIRAMLTDDGLRRREGAANHRRVGQRFTPERVAERWRLALAEAARSSR